MIRYLVVDCDDPVPDLVNGKDGVIQRIIMRVSRTLLDFCVVEEHVSEHPNIVVGVTQYDMSNAETGVKIAIGRINDLLNIQIFENYVILNSDTRQAEAGITDPPRIEGVLYILSSRPKTRYLLRTPDCWWNTLSVLKRKIQEIESGSEEEDKEEEEEEKEEDDDYGEGY
uniref:Uncharacterized protein n=1 Tax=Chionoecetes opilio bacilliform virus TaxID=1825681 RepID=A0A1Q3DLP8_9VIRU|nr:wsv270-like protein [Chionoecetes opilio bacilliform virus]GAV93253.1 hypothetical protein SCV_133 [Chionoecetes opilio bacilliform virus]